jgi:hypothetical protein
VKKFSMLVSIVVIVFFATLVNAVPMATTCIEGCAANGAIAESLTKVDVISYFKVTNLGSNFTIANVYVDFDDSISGSAQLIAWGYSGGNVEFSLGGSPDNLPGGNSHGFNADFTFSAKNPKPKYGLNANGEYLNAFFNNMDLEDLYNDGLVSFGFHLIAFENGGSVSLLTNIPDEVPPPTPTPEPATFGMFGLGLISLISYVRRQRRQV